MIKQILIAVSLLLFSSGISAQSYFADYVIIGSSYTYIRHTTQDFYGAKTGHFNELTWNANLGVRLSKRLVFGLQVLNITNLHKEDKKRYTMYGSFFQYNFLPQEQHRFFGEVSINRGNYCVCKEEIPIQKDNLYYLGFGLGYDLPIKWVKNLYLDLSFVYYPILYKLKENYAYTQYIIGLNYRIN